MREEINEIKRTGVMVATDEESVLLAEGMVDEARAKLSEFVKDLKFGDEDMGEDGSGAKGISGYRG